MNQLFKTNEPSLEQQLKQYGTETYLVKVAAIKPSQLDQAMREADQDEPGMDD